MQRLLSVSLLLSCCLCGCFALPTTLGAETPADKPLWTFVSIPDFTNNDVAFPEPRWDDALDYVLDAIQTEDPAFVLVAGDLVMGRWSQNRQHLEQMASKYYQGWVARMQAHRLKFYVALGDHEIGDDPWEGDKRNLVPFYKKAFRQHLNMPPGGPPGFEQTTYFVRHQNLLLVVLDVFEQDSEGNIHVRVGEQQLQWLQRTFDQHRDARHRVVMAHVPILPNWRWRSSSRLSLPGESDTPLWQMLAANGTDLYLCGEVHDISMQQKNDILQLVSGSQPSNVPEINYLLVDVYQHKLNLTLKSINTILAGATGKQLDPFGVDPYPQRTVRISQPNKQHGFQTVGSMTLDKRAVSTAFDDRTGLFATRYQVFDAKDLPLANRSGHYDGEILPGEANPAWHLQDGTAEESISDGKWHVKKPQNFSRRIVFAKIPPRHNAENEVTFQWSSTSQATAQADGFRIITQGRRLRLYPLRQANGQHVLLTGTSQGVSSAVKSARIDLAQLPDFRADQLNHYRISWKTQRNNQYTFEVSINQQSIGSLPGESFPDSTLHELAFEFRNGTHTIDKVHWKLDQGGKVTENVVMTRARRLITEGRRQLFLDDLMIEQLQNVDRNLHQPKKYINNPIVRHDQTPWQQFRAQLYGTVLYVPEQKLFKMWYLAGARLPIDDPVEIGGRMSAPNFQLVGYAESHNGLDFQLPNLGLISYDGSPANNLCRIARECVEGIAVVLDPDDPDPQRRYKSFYWEHLPSTQPKPFTPVNGMSVSFSADGKSWTDHPDNPVIDLASDSGQQALWDPYLKKYVAYGRFGAGGRKVARSESDDFIHWSPPHRVFETDTRDGPNTQVYGMGISLYEGVYIGLPWMFYEGTSHKINVQLTASRDGKLWSRVANRQVFIPNGPQESWDAGIVFTASQPIQVVDDTIYLYYSASNHDHNYTKRPPQGTPEWDAHWDSIKTSIGVATLRRDGFVSIDAGQQPGTLLTKPLAWPRGKNLYLNVDAGEGLLWVDVLDTATTSLVPLPTSLPVRGNQLGAVVSWPGQKHPSAVLADRQVRLRFTLQKAKLFSYWFQ